MLIELSAVFSLETPSRTSRTWHGISQSPGFLRLCLDLQRNRTGSSRTSLNRAVLFLSGRTEGRTFPGSDHLDPVLCFISGKAASITGSDPNHSWFLLFCRSSLHMVLIKNLVLTEPNVLDSPDFSFSLSREAELMSGYKPPTVWIWIRTASGCLFWTQNRCGPTETSRGSSSLLFLSGNNKPTDPAEPRCSSGPTSPDQGQP